MTRKEDKARIRAQAKDRPAAGDAQGGNEEGRLNMKKGNESVRPVRGSVYCLICTHTVEADLVPQGRRMFVRSGQKCPRCGSSLDAAYVLVQPQAA